MKPEQHKLALLICKQGDAGRSRGLQNEGLRVREDFARMLLSKQN
jgi:hypothetical protein